jgi:hypothetical protein
MTERDTCESVRALLTRFPGEWFCPACLAGRLLVEFRDVSSAVPRLKVVSGFEVAARPCFNCGRARMAVRAAQAPEGASPLAS